MSTQILHTTDTSAANERGAVLAEYALFLSLVAVALVTMIQGLTGGITNAFQAIIDVLP